MIKRKGSIAPKRLIKSIEKKAQHLVAFGCDCQVINNNIYPLEDGNVFIVSGKSHVLKKKRQKTVKGFDFQKINIDASKGRTLNTAIFVDNQSLMWFGDITFRS